MLQLSLPVGVAGDDQRKVHLEADSIGVARSHHMQKYDRQMRLWGGHGQALLESSRVCALGTSALICETLKNLVLPSEFVPPCFTHVWGSVGEFVIVDDARIQQADLGVNFFLSEAPGASRAESAVQNLLELNPDVKGSSVLRNPGELIQAELEWFDGFNMVILDAQEVRSDELRVRLAQHLWQRRVPLLMVRTYGFLGTVRLQCPELLVVETHPSNDRYDLRLHPEQLRRWPELLGFLQRFDLDTPDAFEYAHIPYPAILHHMMEHYRAKVSPEGRLPASWEEKQDFKRLLETHQISASDAGHEHEMKDEEDKPDSSSSSVASAPSSAATGGLNWDQAVQFAYRVYTPAALDALTMAVFTDPAAQEDRLGPASSKFWFLVAALNRFRAENHGDWPLQRALPDMHTTSALYAELKGIFGRRAAQDRAQVRVILDGLLGKALPAGGSAELIDEAELQHFLDHFRELRVIRTRPLAAELAADGQGFNQAEVREILEEWVPEPPADHAGPPPPKNIQWYFGLRAADRFHARHGRYPGQCASGDDRAVDLAADEQLLLKIAQELLVEWGLAGDVEIDNNVVSEITAVGATELHTIAAVVGGIASQIGLKVLLQQYIPINNTFVFSGIHGMGDVYQL